MLNRLKGGEDKEENDNEEVKTDELEKKNTKRDVKTCTYKRGIL